MSVMPQQAPETELVTGTINGIVDKGNGKWQVVVNPDGSQYTRNLWSDDANQVMQLSMMIGQRQTFLCRISNWVGNDGSPRRSLWLQGVGPQAQQAQPQPQTTPMPTTAMPMMPQPQMPQPQVQMPQPQAVSQDEREARIHRQTGSKVAAILISHLPQEQRTLDNLLRIAEHMVAYYEYGMEHSMGQQNPAYGDGDPGPQGAPHSDDDIPF